jgi:cation transport regulator ChaC
MGENTTNSTNKLINIFTYGSLMYPEVMYNLVKKPNYLTEPVILNNYSRRQVKAKTYPGIMQ